MFFLGALNVRVIMFDFWMIFNSFPMCPFSGGLLSFEYFLGA
jgi:hypothetical protein